MAIALTIALVVPSTPVGVRAASEKLNMSQTCPNCGGHPLLGEAGIAKRQEPRCLTPEVITYRCYSCGTQWEYFNYSNPPLGHSYKYSSPANCVHGAVYQCSRCSATEYRGYVNPNNHEWWPLKGATCEEPAQQECLNCHQIESYGSSLGHEFKLYVKGTESNPSANKYDTISKDELSCGTKLVGFCNRCSKRIETIADHKYELSSGATIQHGTKYRCSKCGKYRYDNDRLKAKLTFSASENGGTTDESSQEYTADSSASLTGKTASKSGWEFVGWNTNKAATTALSSVIMDDNKTVYAIFKKDITVDFIDG